MSVGKRLSTSEPLTEHDVAERIDKAALRLWRMLYDLRQIEGMRDAVVSSRYFSGAANYLAAELKAWGIEPAEVKEDRSPRRDGGSPGDTQ